MKIVGALQIGFALILATGTAWGADYSLSNGDQDATVLIDEYQDSLWPYATNVAVGDFNGDGRKDVAIRPIYHVESGLKIVFGRDFKKVSLLSEVESVRVSFPSGMGGAQPVALGDINGDGKDDLLMSDTASGTIRVLFGSSTLAHALDIESANIAISGTAALTGKSLVVGDFNGDGFADVATGYQRGDSRKAVGIVFGGPSLPAHVDLAMSGNVASVVLNTSEWDLLGLMKGHFSRTGADDLVAWVWAPSTNQLLVLGTATWSSTWDLNTVTPTAAARYSRSDTPFDGTVNLSAGDFSGDGVDDIAINVVFEDFPVRFTQRLVDGATLLSLGAWDLNGNAQPPQWLNFSGSPNLNSVSLQALDFDGDGLKDLVGLKDQRVSLDLYLNSDRPALLSPVAFFFGSPSFRVFWTKALNTLLIPGDFNGDGLEDILIHSEVEHRTSPVGAPYSALSFIYGFRPLRNPTVQLRPRPVASSRVDVDLRVKGDPTEMRLSGTISDAIKDQWIPYQRTATVTISSSTGTKKVQAVFRNRFLRESATAEDSFDREVSETKTTVVTNRMGAGRHDLIDCHLSEPAHLRARVFSLSGALIRTLSDDQEGPGIVSVEWDGAGADGSTVAPGVYVVVVEMNDHKETHRVLLK